MVEERPIPAAGARNSATPVRFFATPNPARALDSGMTRVTLTWTIPQGRSAEVRVGAPSGAILAADTRSGSAETGEWVQDGMLFFLQDASQSNSTSPEHTMAIVITSVDNPRASPQRYPLRSAAERQVSRAATVE